MMQTERIILRPWQETDAEALYKYASDPIVGERAGWPPHKSVEESLEIIRTVFNNPTTWAIVLKDTNEAIGAMGYMPNCPLNLPARERQPLVGYWKCGFLPTGEVAVDNDLYSGENRPMRIMKLEF